MSEPSSGTRTFHMIEAVADRLEGARRQLRRRWSDEFKAQIVAEALAPGASVSAIRGINPRAAEGHAPGQTHHKVWLVAAIYRSALRIAGVGDAQPPPASPAGHHPRQECPATSAGLCASGTTVIVKGELLLVALIFGPADIAFVMIFDHHLPCPDRLAMPVAPPCPPFDDGGAFLAFPVDVNACTKKILENRDDVAVADRHPVEAGHATFVGGAREVDPIGFHRDDTWRALPSSRTRVKMIRITSWRRRSGSRPSPASRCLM